MEIRRTHFFRTFWNHLEPSRTETGTKLFVMESCKIVLTPRRLITILLGRESGTRTLHRRAGSLLEFIKGGWGTENCYARFFNIWPRRFGEPVIGWTYPEARNEQMQP